MHITLIDRLRPIALTGLLACSLTLAGCASIDTSQPSRTSNPASSPADSRAAGSSTAAPASIRLSQEATPGAELQAALPPVSEADRQDPNLLVRLRAGFAMPELPSSLTDRYVERFSRSPQYLDRVFGRGGRYLYHIVQELEARGMPTELALLPIVESAFNPQATSKAKAAGLWQFIPSTGRSYDLTQNWWLDERRDPIESTRAALDYLNRIYKLQGNDWFLALASYNAGEGTVLKARKRSRASGKSDDYQSIRLPRETAHYVPQLIALRNILRNPEAYGLKLPYVENRPYLAVLDKTQSIDLTLAASFAELSLDEFKALNPHLTRPVLTISRTNRVVLPVDRVADYERNLREHQAAGLPLVTWEPYTMKPGDTLASIAAKRDLTLQELTEANGLKAKQKLLPGSALLVPVANPQLAKDLDRRLDDFKGARTVERVAVPSKTYKVRKGDTLAKIAKKFAVSQSTLRTLNKLQGEVKPGRSLVIRGASEKTVTTGPGPG